MSPSVREPFVGPRPFDRGDSSLFFGRERETQDLVSLVMAHRALLLYAPSGAGKSSLLNARVIPELTTPERGALILGPARVSGRLPDDVAPETVDNIFAFHLLTSLGVDTKEAAMGRVVACVERLVERHAHESDAPAVLVIDQFEEVFTRQVDRWKEREPFFKALGAASESLACLRIVFAMREEYLASLAPFVRFLPERVRAQYRLERLRRDAALEAIERPVELAGRSFAPGAAEELLGNLLRIPVPGDEQKEIEGEFVEPVHLQVACRNVWNSLRDDQNVIDLSLIRAAGSLDVALQEYFDACVAAAASSANEPESHVRDWIENVLVTSEGTRSIVAKSPSLTAGLKTSVVEHLESQHVLRAELRGGAVFYELAHDRFLQPVRRSNRAWRVQQLSRSPELAELEARAAAWIAGGRTVRKPSLADLARRGADVRFEAAALQTAERLLASKNHNGLEPSVSVREYFEAHREVHRAARQRLALVYLAMVSIVAVGLLSALLLIGAKYRQAVAAESRASEAWATAVIEQTKAEARAAEAQFRSEESHVIANALAAEKELVEKELEELRQAANAAIRERDALLAQQRAIEVNLTSLNTDLEVKQREAANATQTLAKVEERQRTAELAADDRARAAAEAQQKVEVAQNMYSSLVERSEQVKQSTDEVERAAALRRTTAADAIARLAAEPGQELPALVRGVELLADALRAGAANDEVRAALGRAWEVVMTRTPLAPAGVTDVEVALDPSGSIALAWNAGGLSAFDARTRAVLWRRVPRGGSTWSHVELAAAGDVVLAVSKSLSGANVAQIARRAGANTRVRVVLIGTRDGATLGEREVDLADAWICQLDPRSARMIVAGVGGTRALGLDGSSIALDARVERPNACAISADGTRIAMRFGDALRLVDGVTGRSITTLSFDTSNEWFGAPQSLAFSADSARFAACGFVSRFFGSNTWRVAVHSALDGSVLMRADVALNELTPGWVGLSDEGSSVTVVGTVPTEAQNRWRAITFDVATGTRASSNDFAGEPIDLRRSAASFLAVDTSRGVSQVVAWNLLNGSVDRTELIAPANTRRILADEALQTWIVAPPGSTPELRGAFDNVVAPDDARELLTRARELLVHRDEYAPLFAATSDL